MTSTRPRRILRAALVSRPRLKAPGVRAPVDSDAAALARLMWTAYRGTTDDEGKSEAEALAEVRKTARRGALAALIREWIKHV